MSGGEGEGKGSASSTTRRVNSFISCAKVVQTIATLVNWSIQLESACWIRQDIIIIILLFQVRKVAEHLHSVHVINMSLEQIIGKHITKFCAAKTYWATGNAENLNTY